MSLMMACTSIAPMLAPLIGGQILWFLGWRAIFWALALIGALACIASYFWLPETLRPEYRQPLVLSSILKRFGELVRHRAFMGYAFTSSFMFSALLSFISGSPFVFIERYGIAPRDYGLIFGGMIPLGSLEAGLMADFIGTPATMAIGALICALAAVVTLQVIRRREAQLGTTAQRIGA